MRGLAAFLCTPAADQITGATVTSTGHHVPRASVNSTVQVTARVQLSGRPATEPREVDVRLRSGGVVVDRHAQLQAAGRRELDTARLGIHPLDPAIGLAANHCATKVVCTN